MKQILTIATINNNADIINILVNAGADVNAKNADGNSPMIFAATMGNTEIAKILI